MAENTQIVEYESNGEIVKISPTMIKRYLVSGGGNVSDGEVIYVYVIMQIPALKSVFEKSIPY